MSNNGQNIGGVNSQDGSDAVLSRYEAWANDYEKDLAAVNYRLPELMAELFVQYVPHGEQASILDAGCGTGLSGQALRRAGFLRLTGVDLSHAMMRIAEEKNVYDRLMIADLTSLPFSDGEFDHTIAVGTVGVAPAICLAELARVTRPGGIIMFSNRRGEHYAEDAGFVAQQDRLEQNNRWELAGTIERLIADDKPGSDPFVVFTYRRGE